MPGLGDHERRARADDLDAFLEDPLEVTWVAVRACQLERSRRGHDVGERHDPAFDLRDRLLRNDDDITVGEPAGTPRTLVDQRTEIMPVPELREADDWDDSHLSPAGATPTASSIGISEGR